MKTGIIAGCVLGVACSSPTLFADGGADPRAVNGTNPQKDMVAVADGSGLIVGPRYVLTNGHVAVNDGGIVEGGFKVFLPKDYKKGVSGRVIYVCRNYDLAIIELSEEVPSPLVRVLEQLPPLGQKVTAYGFPTGSRFGVSLTTTGGQISRHPVEIDNTDEKQMFGIKSSLWHDAVLTGGSSGGPLMTESGVLLGLNRAVLVQNNDHALAVPCHVVLDFLEKTKLHLNLQRVTSPENGSATDVSDSVVLIEVYSSLVGDRESSGRLTARSEMTKAITEFVAKSIRSQLTDVPRRQLTRMRTSGITAAFVPVKPVNISEGHVLRIASKMTIIQVLDEGILAKLDGVMCRIEAMGGDNAEFAAKTGNRIVENVPLDSVFLVGKARSYPTVRGTEGHYIPLYPVSSLLTENDFTALIDEEIQRRSGGGSRAADPDPADVTAALERYRQKLRHTFLDASGKFSVDAAAVEVNGDQVRLLTIDEGKEVKVPLSRLSEDDRRWLRENDAWIKTYGKKYEQLLVGEEGN